MKDILKPTIIKSKSGTSSTEGLSDRIRVTDFTEEAAQKFHNQVMKAAEELPETFPIIVYISSYGGYVDALASMVETLESVPHKIITVCQGYAMSCDAILFSCGDYRFMGRHSRVMIHEVSGVAFGDTHDIVNDATETKRLNEYWLGMLAKNSGLKSYDELRSMIKNRDGRDIWLNAQESVKFGIADFIGLPQLEPYTVAQILVKPERIKERLTKKKATRKKTGNKTINKKTASKKTRKRSIAIKSGGNDERTEK